VEFSATAALPTHPRNRTGFTGLWEHLPREWAGNCNCASSLPALIFHYLLKRGGTHANTHANTNEEEAMAWTTPTLVEICIGLEINGYLPAEF
jgi:coenzyme PQQ precursor peptide PqqA